MSRLSQIGEPQEGGDPTVPGYNERHKCPPITVAQFQNMVHVFSDRDSTPEEKQNVDRALNNLYKLPEAWVICREVIQVSSPSDTFLSFVCIRILRIKMMTYFDELGEEEHAPLFMFLIGALKKTTHAASKTQLSDCIMLLYIRIFEQQRNLLELLNQNFPCDCAENIPIVLEILETLPALLVDEKVVISDSLRKRALEHLVTYLQPKVFMALEEIATQCPNLEPKQRLQLLKCFDSWIINGSSEFLKTSIDKMNLFRLCFEELQSPVRLHQEEAGDAIISVLKLFNDSDKHHNVYNKVLEWVASYAEHFQSILANSATKDMAKPLLLVYETIVRRLFLKPFIDPDMPVIKHLISNVLFGCYSHPGSTLVSLASLSFQKMFEKLGSKEELMKYAANPAAQQLAGQQTSTYSTTSIRFIHTYLNLFGKLVELAVSRHLRYSPEMMEMYNIPNVDFYTLEEQTPELDDKNVTRSDVIDMIRSMANTLGLCQIFAYLQESFEQLEQQLQNPATNKDSQFYTWVESLLTCYQVCIPGKEFASQPEVAKIVLSVLEFSLRIEVNSFKVNMAIVNIIQDSAPFCNGKSELLRLTTDFLVRLMKSENKRFEWAAAEAFQQLCEFNPKFIHGHLDRFMELYLSLQHQKSIVRGYTSAVNELSDEQGQRQLKQKYINQICSPFTTKLYEIATFLEGVDQQGSQKLDAFSANLIVERNATIILNSVSNLIEIASNLDKFRPQKSDFHVLSEVLVELWPVLSVILRYTFDNPKIVENCCQLIKWIMKTIGVLFAPFLDSYFELAKTNYSKKPISTYLYTVENALTIFYNDPKVEMKLGPMYQHMIRTSLRYISVQELQEQRLDPDLLDDFFGLTTRFLRLKHEVVTGDVHMLNEQLHLGLKYIRHTHNSVVKAIVSFFEECFKTATITKEAGLMHQMLYNADFGKRILRQVFCVLIDDFPYSASLRAFIMSLLDHVFVDHKPGCLSWVLGCWDLVPASVLNLQEKEEFTELIKTQGSRTAARSDVLVFLDKLFTRCLHHKRMA